MAKKKVKVKLIEEKGKRYFEIVTKPRSKKKNKK